MNTKLDIDDGFVKVVRKNNPLRKFGLVHSNLGKIGPVRPTSALNIVYEMVQSGMKFGTGPVIGLSESSILLGRLVSEFTTHSPFIFSTRYPVQGMISFIEPHSHAPNHYLNINAIQDASEICIVEDEVTSGNTLLGLIQVLLDNLPKLKSIWVASLKMFCSTERVRQMQAMVAIRGARLHLNSVYRGTIDHEDPLVSQNIPDRKETLPVYNSFLETGRGRTEPFFQPEIRYTLWNKRFHDMSGQVTVIGVSEAIDIAFEISNMLEQIGCESSFRHLTISPWDLPGWVFPGLRPLHLYYPIGRGGQYIIVYDNPIQREQVHMLYARLISSGTQVSIIGPDEQLWAN